MKKLKKVRRRAFTEKQLDLLEQYHYLYKKLYRVGLNEQEEDYLSFLIEKVTNFITIV